MRRIILYSAVVLATLALALLLFLFRDIIFLLLLSIIVSAAIQPVVQFVVDRLKLPLVYATISIYLVALVIVVLFLVVPANALINETQDLFNDIAATYEHRYPEWMEGTTLEQAIAGNLPPPDELYQALTGPILGEQILGFTRGLVGVFGGGAVVLVLSIYWTIDQARLERYWLSILPTERRVQARKVWRATGTGIGAYIRSELVQSMAAALILLAVYALIGLDYPFILAGLAAAAWLIPLVGALFAVLPVLGVGLLHGTIGLSVLAALVTFGILSGLELLVEPRLFNRRRVNSTTTVLLMLVLVQDFGLIGLIMAPPITAALQILFNHLIELITAPRKKKPVDQIERLEERLAEVMKAQQENGQEVSDGLTNLGQRLSKLLAEAKQLS